MFTQVFNDKHFAIELIKLTRPEAYPENCELLAREGMCLLRFKRGIAPITDEEIAEFLELAEKNAVMARFLETRAAAYEERGCSIADCIDGLTKQASHDPIVRAEGDAQFASVMAARLQVKVDFPKPKECRADSIE